MFFNFLRNVGFFNRKIRHKQGPAQTKTLLRILSHNVGQDLPNYDALAGMICSTNADITLLQEITRDFVDRYWDSKLSKLYPYRVYGPFLEEKQVASGILSRYPIVGTKDFKLADSALVFQQRALIDIQGKTIVIYNIHLTFPWIKFKRDPILNCIPLPTYDNHTRNEEIRSLVSMIYKENEPILLAGDFNLSDRSADYNKLAQILVDTYRVSGTGFGFSWPANRTPSLYIPIHIPFVRIDYVFHSHTLMSCSAQFLRKTGSDHRPLLVEVGLNY